MKTLYTKAEIDAALSKVASEIVADMGPNFTMVSILTGGFVFAADLIRALTEAGADPEIDFIQLSSYGQARQSSGEVRWLKDLTTPVEGQNVLLVDDVLESGRSLHAARDMMRTQGAARTVICVAVSKLLPRANPVEADYSLFNTDGDAFLVGYGMDDGGRKRGLPDLMALEG